MRRSDRVAEVLIVTPEARCDETRVMFGAAGTPVRAVAGGASRAESVANGLRQLSPASAYVLVHDAARPLVNAALVESVLDAIGDADGAIAAAPLADTPKRVDADGRITGTVPREGLWLAQTPQAFRADALRAAVDLARRDGRLHQATDCSALVEAAGGTVRVVPWSQPNLKVTTPSDLRLAEVLLSRDGDPGVG